MRGADGTPRRKQPLKHRSLASAYQRFGAGRLDEAESICRSILRRSPLAHDALHLLGLVTAGQGKLQEARRLLQRVRTADPRNVAVAINLSKVLSAQKSLDEAESVLRDALVHDDRSAAARLALARVLRDAGKHRAAIHECDQLIAADKNDAEAHEIKAGAHRALGDAQQAESSYKAALSIAGDYGIVRHNFGAFLCETHRPRDALVQLGRAEASGIREPELFYNKATSHMKLGQLEAAEAEFLQAVEKRPHYLDAQTGLAKLRFMRGDEDFLRTLEEAAARSNDPRMSLTLGELALRAGDVDRSDGLLRRLWRDHPGLAGLASSIAVVKQQQGQLSEALRFAERAYDADAGNPDVAENFVSILLETGDPVRASRICDHWRGRCPTDQRWIAYAATVSRLDGTGLYEELYDYDRFTAVYDLDAPRGFQGIEAFHDVLVPVLLKYHPFQRQPLDQSLVGGTQSAMDVRGIDHECVRALFSMIESYLDDFVRRIGFRAGHPFLERNRRRARISGAWSVRLRSGGYHIDHIHSKGWISTAYYAKAHAGAAAQSQHAGCLKLGQPHRLGDRLGAERFIQPKPGRLVVFPSYMWHGTVPVAGESDRIAVASDALP